MALADFIEVQGLARSGTDIHCKVIGRTRILLLTDNTRAPSLMCSQISTQQFPGHSQTDCITEPADHQELAQGTVDIGGSSR